MMKEYYKESDYIKRCSTTWLGECFTICQQDGGGTIQRFSVEPGIELSLFTDCTYEAHAQKMLANRPRLIEITSLSQGTGKIRCDDESEWLFFNPKELLFFNFSEPIKHYDFACHNISGISICIDILAANRTLPDYEKKVDEEWQLLYYNLFNNHNYAYKKSTLAIFQTITKQLLGNFDKTMVNHLFIKAKTLEFLMHCLNMEASNTSTNQMLDCVGTSVHRIKEYIDKNYCKDLRVDMLAKKFHISLAELQKSFKYMLGCTVYSYIQKKRMQHAAKLLQETLLPVTEVALEVGYDNPSKFATLFKRMYLQTPTEYRRTNIN